MRVFCVAISLLLLTSCQTTFRSGFSRGLQSNGEGSPPPLQDEKHLREIDALKWPVKTGRVTQTFVNGDHWGIDIAAPTGTPIYAAHSGRVIYSGRGFKGYGKFVILKSGNLATFYSHCHRLHVKQGQWVEEGQLIGKVGRTGNATGPHLHFEVRHNRTPMDPLVYLPLQ